MATSPVVTLGQAVRDPKLLGASIAWWPAQLELLDALDGPEELVLWAIARQCGKTSMAAALAIHNATLRPDLDEVLPRGRIRYTLVAAASEVQAVEFIRVAAALIEESPLLCDLADVRSARIEFEIPRVDADGRRWFARSAIRALTSSSSTTRGMSASALLLDEYAHVVDPGADARLYAALVPSLRRFGPKAKTLITSTPNGKSGKFAELFEAAEAGSLKHAAAWQATAMEMDPGVSPEWLEARRQEFGEALYEQEFEARFVDGAGSFFNLSEVEFDDDPTRPEDGEGWVCALDPAFHRDSFGYALLGRSRHSPGELVVGAVGAIRPQGRAKSFEARRLREDATLAAIWDRIEPYAPSRIVSDQHNSAAIQSFFGRRGIHVEVVNLTRPAQTEAFVSLRARLVDGSLRCWREPQLVEELRRVRAKGTDTIFLPRFGDSHCDVAAALALAVSKVGADGPMEIVVSGRSLAAVPATNKYAAYGGSEFS